MGRTTTARMTVTDGRMIMIALVRQQHVLYSVGKA